jgi:hypothetical protein
LLTTYDAGQRLIRTSSGSIYEIALAERADQMHPRLLVHLRLALQRKGFLREEE